MRSGEIADLLVAFLGRDPPSAQRFQSLDKKAQDQLLLAATTHGLGPLLYRRLSELGGGVPPTLLGPLRDVYLHSSLRNQALRDDAATVFQSLREAGVRAIALKGVHLAFAVYQDPALRPMNDIDLLVRPEDVGRATSVLQELGYGITDALGAKVDYSLMHHARPVIKAGSVSVEVHHALEQPGNPFSVDQEGIWSRANSTDNVPGGADVLSAEDLLLHLCTHVAYNHAFDVRLLALRDVMELLQCYRGVLNWTAVRSVAEVDGRERFVRMALAVTERLWRGSLPSAATADWRVRAGEAVTCETAVEYVKQVPVEIPVAVREMRDGRTVRKRVRALLTSVFPSPRRMREIYRIPEAGSVWWTYVWRPFDLVRRRGVRAIGLAAGLDDTQGALARTESEERIRRWVRGDAAIP